MYKESYLEGVVGVAVKESGKQCKNPNRISESSCTKNSQTSFGRHLLSFFSLFVCLCLFASPGSFVVDVRAKAKCNSESF